MRVRAGYAGELRAALQVAEGAKVWINLGTNMVRLTAIVGVAIFVMPAFSDRVTDTSIGCTDTSRLIPRGDRLTTITSGALSGATGSWITCTGAKRFEVIEPRHT